MAPSRALGPATTRRVQVDPSYSQVPSQNSVELPSHPEIEWCEPPKRTTRCRSESYAIAGNCRGEGLVLGDVCVHVVPSYSHVAPQKFACPSQPLVPYPPNITTSLSRRVVGHGSEVARGWTGRRRGKTPCS